MTANKLIDTCGWIEWITNGQLIKSFSPHFTNLSHIIIPTLIQYELYKWVCREKDQAIALEIIGVTEQGIITPLDTKLALYAAEIAKEYKLAMADAIIYATSIRNNATLITCDKHFYALPDVIFFEK